MSISILLGRLRNFSRDGTLAAVDPFHLDRYLDGQMFRFDNRQNKMDEQRFQTGLAQAYQSLIGTGSGPSTKWRQHTH
jgi:hypothetical protein